MKYHKIYSNRNELENIEIPSITLIYNDTQSVDDDEVILKGYNTSNDYLTFVALDNDCTFSFSFNKLSTTTAITSVSYSIDNGETWTTLNNVNDKEEDLVIQAATIHKGEKILWKGTADSYGYCSGGTHTFSDFDENNYYSHFLCSGGNFKAYGNIMSMNYGDNFSEESELLTSFQCAGLFLNCSNIVDASNMFLGKGLIKCNGAFCMLFWQAANLAKIPKIDQLELNSNYSNAFRGTFGYTAITTLPKLNYTRLSNGCYAGLFIGTNITSIPIDYLSPYNTSIPAYAYRNMFQATNITETCNLPATSINAYSYAYMFYNCSKLTKINNIDFTTLSGNYNCNYMFRNCDSLVDASNVILKPVNLKLHSYTYMFYDCDKLVNGPHIEATTVDSIYGLYYVFGRCGNLKNMPPLKIVSLRNYTFHYLFYGCSKLAYIKSLHTTTPTSSVSGSWVKSVAANGVFIRANNATYATTRGVHTIPANWDLYRDGLKMKCAQNEYIDSGLFFDDSKNNKIEITLTITSNSQCYLLFSSYNGANIAGLSIEIKTGKLRFWTKSTNNVETDKLTNLTCPLNEEFTIKIETKLNENNKFEITASIGENIKTYEFNRIGLLTTTMRTFNDHRSQQNVFSPYFLTNLNYWDSNTNLLYNLEPVIKDFDIPEGEEEAPPSQCGIVDTVSRQFYTSETMTNS